MHVVEQEGERVRMSEHHHSPETGRHGDDEWLRHRHDPVERTRLVQHLFGPVDRPPTGEPIAKPASALETHQEKLAAVEAEVAALRELLRSRAATEEPASQEPAHQPEPEPAEHLLFVPGAHGYSLVEASGQAPAVGSTVAVGDETSAFVVAKVGSSPYPGDRRVCAYLEAPSPSH